MKIRINLSAKRLGTSPDVFKRIISEFSKLEKNQEKITEFSIDIHELEEISLPACILIWTLARKYQFLKCKKGFLGSKKDKIKRDLDESHFFDRLTGKKTNLKNEVFPIHFETFSPKSGNGQSETNTIVEKIFEKTTKKLLNESLPLQSEVASHIREIFENAFFHSDSGEKKAVCLCRKRGDIFEFCVCDQGQGMKKSFLQNPKISEKYRKMSDIEILEEATKLGSTCNPKWAKNPKYHNLNSGMGLFFTKKFIELHKNSRLIIFSGSGLLFVESDGKIKRISFSETAWSGTLVFFQTNLDQGKNQEYSNLSEQILEDNELSFS